MCSLDHYHKEGASLGYTIFFDCENNTCDAPVPADSTMWTQNLPLETCILACQLSTYLTAIIDLAPTYYPECLLSLQSN